MAKIKDIEASRGAKGDWYNVDEILGQDIEILENIGQDSDIREHETKSKNIYYCIKIRHDTEKDLHLTRAALLAVAGALPKNESWQGYKIKINRSGKGFATSYLVHVLGKGIAQYSQSPIADPAGRIISNLKQAPSGMLDKAFWEMVYPIVNPIVGGNVTDSMLIVDRLKNEGRILNQAGTWRVT